MDQIDMGSFFKIFSESLYHQYWDERFKNPSWLAIKLDENFKSGDRVFIEAHLQQYTDCKIGDENYLKCCPILIDEYLTSSVCDKLRIALDIIKRLQGISSREALAYLTFHHLIDIDMKRIAEGGDSILYIDREIQYENFYIEQRNIEGENHRLDDMRPAEWSLEQMLDFWYAFGGKSSLELPAFDLKGGKWLYYRIPPVWITVHSIERVNEMLKIFGECIEPMKTLEWLKPEEKLLLESTIGYLKSMPNVTNPIDLDSNCNQAHTEEVITKDTNVFRKEGGYWQITYQGRKLNRIKHLIGLKYISILLGNPGEKGISCIDLVKIANRSKMSDNQNGDSRFDNNYSETPNINTRSSYDANDLLDEKAKKDIQNKILELEEEINESESACDTQRYDKARSELDALLYQLKKDTALGGKSRRFPDENEKIRRGVTKAIANVIRNHIMPVDTELGKHLAMYIKKGKICKYNPDPSESIAWIL